MWAALTAILHLIDVDLLLSNVRSSCLIEAPTRQRYSRTPFLYPNKLICSLPQTWQYHTLISKSTIHFQNIAFYSTQQYIAITNCNIFVIFRFFDFFYFFGNFSLETLKHVELVNISWLRQRGASFLTTSSSSSSSWKMSSTVAKSAAFFCAGFPLSHLRSLAPANPVHCSGWSLFRSV